MAAVPSIADVGAQDRRPLVDTEPANPVEQHGLGQVGVAVADRGQQLVLGVGVEVDQPDLLDGLDRHLTEQLLDQRLSGGAALLTDDQRDLTYYNVSLGINLFPGESFLGSRWAFKGGLYLIGGVGSTDFAGDERFTINAGVGYRLIATDWLAFHVTVRDHFFQSDLLGAEDDYHNIEFTGALSLFFLAFGMGVPLIIMGTGGGHLLPRAGGWMEEIKRFFGITMLGIAIWLLDRIIADSLAMGLMGFLLAGYGVYLGALEQVAEGASRLKRTIALMLALYGMLLVVGAAGGGSDPLQPLQREANASATVSAPQAQDTGAWRKLVGSAALQQAMAEAKAAGKPMLVDF